METIVHVCTVINNKNLINRNIRHFVLTLWDFLQTIQLLCTLFQLFYYTFFDIFFLNFASRLYQRAFQFGFNTFSVR